VRKGIIRCGNLLIESSDDRGRDPHQNDWEKVSDVMNDRIYHRYGTTLFLTLLSTAAAGFTIIPMDYHSDDEYTPNPEARRIYERSNAPFDPVITDPKAPPEDNAANDPIHPACSPGARVLIPRSS
jgi:hypothetical protein